MNAKDKTILLVEDEAITAITQKKSLENYGYHVITANTGLKAIEIFKTTEDIDLILMDIDLGAGMNGPETATIILKDKEIPIVFLSSHTEPEIVEKTEKITSYGYVVKSSSITVLDASIKMAFKLFYANHKIVESESTIKRKLNSILEPDGDIGELTLGDIIDTEAIQNLMREFHKVTPITSAIIDISGNVLVAYGWQDICKKFHRINPETLKNCIESDVTLSCGVPVGSFKAYKCKNNMWDIATPIEIGGKHLGNIYLGQFFYEDENLDYELFRNQARQYGFDEKEYIDALERVPRYSRETVESIMAFYSNLAKLISSLSYSKIKLSRSLAQHDISLLQLKESEAKYSSYVKNAPDGILITDEKGNYLEVNEAACQITGYTKEELLKMSIPDIAAEDSLETALALFTILLETCKSTGEHRYKHKDGSIRWWAVDAVKITDSHYIGFVRDISDLKQIEAELKIKIEEIEATNEELAAAIEEMEATNEELHRTTAELEVNEKILQKSENNFRLLFQNKDSINSLYEVLIDDNGKPCDYRYLEVNPEFEKHVGMKASELIGRTLLDVFPQTEQFWMDKFEEVITTGISAHIDNYSKELDLYTDLNIYTPQRGQLALTSIDISERKHAEDALKKSESFFRFLAENSTDIISRHDEQGKYLYVSPACRKLLGYEPGEILGHYAFEFIHPEDNQKVEDSRSNITTHPILSTTEFRIRHKNGQYIWFETISEIITDETGTGIEIYAASRDITKRKQSEDKTIDLLAEKKLVLKETHHRVKNFMSTISGLIFLQSESLQDPIAISALKDIDTRIKSMMLLYNNIYTSNNFEEISVKNYIPPLVDEILSNFPNMGSVKIVKNIEDFIIEAKKIQPVGIIINELLTNIMKYAFTDRSEGLITISTILKENHCILEIQDNGVGMPESINFENSSGFGMQLVKMLSEQIEASIRIERGEGTKFILEFEV